jgi:hypothetical protein
VTPLRSLVSEGFLEMLVRQDTISGYQLVVARLLQV